MNKNVLIDSHILIWLLYEPEKIGPKSKEILKAADKVYVSVVTLWELALKFKVHKLAYSPVEFIKGVTVLNLEKLNVQDNHIVELLSVSLPRKDPFDTLLVAQAKAENCIFITADQNILRSQVRFR